MQIKKRKKNLDLGQDQMIKLKIVKKEQILLLNHLILVQLQEENELNFIIYLITNTNIFIYKNFFIYFELSNLINIFEKYIYL